MSTDRVIVIITGVVWIVAGVFAAVFGGEGLWKSAVEMVRVFVLAILVYYVWFS